MHSIICVCVCVVCCCAVTWLCQGAKIAVGGSKPVFPNDASLKGHFFSGTVLTDVTEDMDIMKEEIFGPVLPIYRFKTESEVCPHATHVHMLIRMGG